MNIAIVGTGNIGGALATKWALKGHTILLGVNNQNQFKGRELLNNQNTSVSSISEAVSKSEVVLIAIPPTAIFEVLPQLNLKIIFLLSMSLIIQNILFVITWESLTILPKLIQNGDLF